MDGVEDASVGGSPDAQQVRARRTTVDHVTILQASPLRVWSVLTDFAGHRNWKPFIQLAGDAIEGGDSTYSYRVGGLDKRITATAAIIRVEKPREFAWTAGVSKLLLFEEAYELESAPTGTRLRHSMRFTGLLGGPLVALRRRILEASLVTSDRCLERYLRRLAANSSAKLRSASARHGVKKTGRQK